MQEAPHVLELGNPPNLTNQTNPTNPTNLTNLLPDAASFPRRPHHRRAGRA
jgi:hypothetical protein